MFEIQPDNMDFGCSHVKYEPKLQVAPVVDLVLFLIWFYLLVGQFVIHQKDSVVQLPQMNSPLSQAEAPAEFVINIRADGSIWVDGRQMDLPTLEQAMLGESAKARKTGQSLHVVVRADRRQRYANLDKVLDIWGKTGLAQVDFRAEGG